MHNQNPIAKTILFWALFIGEMVIHFHLSYAYYVYESIAGSHQGPHEKRLLNNLLNNYNTLERPVSNESDALSVRFGLTLQQIIDVVSVSGFDYLFSVSMVLMDRADSSKMKRSTKNHRVEFTSHIHTRTERKMQGLSSHFFSFFAANNTIQLEFSNWFRTSVRLLNQKNKTMDYFRSYGLIEHFPYFLFFFFFFYAGRKKSNPHN